MERLSRLMAAPAALRELFETAVSNHLERRKLRGVHFGNDVIIRGADRIKVGSRVFLDHRAYLNCNSQAGRSPSITLGDNVEIGPYSVLWGGGGITIGNNVHLGAHVHITSMEGCQVAPQQTDPHAPLCIDSAAVVIGDHVLICSNSVVVPGVTIGHHAMVAAGAVVAHDVPPYALVAGVPARIVRYTNETAAAPTEIAAV